MLRTTHLMLWKVIRFLEPHQLVPKNVSPQVAESVQQVTRLDR